jgi:S-DNA-T family DNA segregation ATPase FtsK/SpoIIIE
LSDSKSIEFSFYKGHSKVQKIVSSFDENLYMLKNLISIMETRFNILKTYKEQTYKKVYNMSTILVVIDELADLILQDKNNEFKNSLLKLSQKCRAAGIFIVAATQRPSVDVLSGTIKANFPARIALKAASSIDSKVILDQPGAEFLKGRGDAIIKNDKYHFLRFRFPFIEPLKLLKNI